MKPKVRVYNFSQDPRTGYFEFPWLPFRQQLLEAGIPEDSFILWDEETDNEVSYQVDLIDPNHTSRSMLIGALGRLAAPASSDRSPSMTLTAAPGNPSPSCKEWQRTTLHEHAHGQRRGVTLTSSRLMLFFNFTATLQDDDKAWYAGSATSVRLNGREVLASGEWLQHDREKRCMQLSTLYLLGAVGEPVVYSEVDLFDKDYEYVFHADGPLRSTITVASLRFQCNYFDPTVARERALESRLYRVISLYHDGDYVTEEIYIRPASDGRAEGLELLPPHFMIRYFSHMDFGHDRAVFQLADIPDWFAIAASWAGNKPGYGFATNVHATPVAYPHRDTKFAYDDPIHENQCSWLLFPCNSAKCVHHFMRRREPDFDAHTGRLWYNVIYQPLLARFTDS